MDITEAASQLGCQYVLEGSVREAGERVRITAQLIDGATGNHIWAENYDRVLEDIFAVQDDVAATIISTLAGRIEAESRLRATRKAPSNLTAYEHVLRGRYLWPDYRDSKNEIFRAREEFGKALELDPECAAAYAALSASYINELFYGWSPDPDAAGENAYDHARKAVELDDRDAQAHLWLAYVYLYVKSNFDLVEVQLQKSIDLSPNDYQASCAQIAVAMRDGDFAESISYANEAIRRNPFLPDFCLSERGVAEYFAGQYDNAIRTFGTMLTTSVHVQGCIAACYAQLGRNEEARIAAAEFSDRAEKELTIDWDAESWRDYWSSFFVLGDPEPNERLLDGLRKAGLS